MPFTVNALYDRACTAHVSVSPRHHFTSGVSSGVPSGVSSGVSSMWGGGGGAALSIRTSIGKVSGANYVGGRLCLYV